MKLSMARLKSDDGFTLIEMLIVLSSILMILILFPVLHPETKQIKMRLQMLRYQLLQCQEQAIAEGRTVEIAFSEDEMDVDGERIFIGMRCNQEVIFHPNGNVNHAMTMRCHTADAEGELVIQLGSGRIYVK